MMPKHKALKQDRTLRNVIPALTSEEYSELESSIIREGCRHPILTWNGLIIDGHNRYDICVKNKIEFKTEEMHFKDKKEALDWMITNQLARRNLTEAQRIEMALKRNEIRGSQSRVHFEHQKPLSREKRVEIAEELGVSETKVAKVKKVLEEGDKKTKKDMKNGKTTINKAYKKTTGKPNTQKKPKAERANDPGPEPELKPVPEPEPDQLPKNANPEQPQKIPENKNTTENPGPTITLKVRKDNTVFIPTKVCGPDSVVEIHVLELVEAQQTKNKENADMWVCPGCGMKHSLNLDTLKKCRGCGYPKED